MTRALLALAPIALLAACSGSEPEAAPADNAGIDQGVVIENALDTPFVNAEASPTPTPSATPTEEAPTPDERAQIQEDADATGMTARVDREAAPANEASAVGDTTSEEKN